MSTAEAIAANPDLQKALQKAVAMATKAAADEATAKERRDQFDRWVANGDYNGPTGIIVGGRFPRHVTQAEVMREDSRPVRAAAKRAKQSRQAATDAATDFVAALAAALAAK